MKYISIILLIIAFSCKDFANNEKKEIQDYSDSILAINLCENAKKTALTNLERNNIIAYTFNYRPHLQEFLFNNYNIIYQVGDSLSNHCGKKIMDSVIFSKYGNGFYENVNAMINIMYREVPDEINLDGNYNYVDSLPKYLNNGQELYEFLIQDITKEDSLVLNNNTRNDLLLEIIIDSTGNTKSTRIIKKLNPVIDEKILKRADIIPGKWKPAIFKNKKVNFIYWYPISFGKQEKTYKII